MIGISVDEPYVPDITPVSERVAIDVPEPNIKGDPLNDISPDAPDSAYVVIE